ncbi:MAG: protocatechuate 3,4-dioxygenase [Myxococcota bacterium]|nr:protocatechuate 3,4-dioxygenase [Myxococcota bacterium]
MQFDRRDLLRSVGLGLVTFGCGGSSSSEMPDAANSDGPKPDSKTAGKWATGGTVSMTDKATYPDPFTAPAAMCVLVASTTAGPCTTATDLAREDVSEGNPGLPMRLALRVVGSACNPIAGAQVIIWHTNIEGSYSGQTPNNAFCLKNQSYSAVNFFRGVQTTNSAGIVYFDTCYPGWYPGRAIHIHFQVKNGATTYRVSQLFFPEALTAEIFATHSEYKPFGAPNTTNTTDNIVSAIPAASRSRLICEYARMTDGAMLASKTVTVT